MVSHFLLHRIFQNRGSNLHLLHGRQILYHWATREAPPRDVRIKFEIFICNQSVQFLSTPGLQPHGLQHTRLPCPTSTPRARSNSCPLNWWCHAPISYSIIPFSSCFQSLPASRSFPRSQFFTSGGQNIGVLASASSFQWIFRTDFL